MQCSNSQDQMLHYTWNVLAIVHLQLIKEIDSSPSIDQQPALIKSNQIDLTVWDVCGSSGCVMHSQLTSSSTVKSVMNILTLLPAL